MVGTTEGHPMSTPMMSASALGARREEVSAAKTLPQDRYLCFGAFQVDLQREELFKAGNYCIDRDVKGAVHRGGRPPGVV